MPNSGHYSLLMVGGGHSHALVLAQWRRQGRPKGRIALVNDHPFAPYSGMLPGLLAGHYQPEQCFIDLAKLCASLDIEFMVDSLQGVQASQRQVQLGQGQLSFDYLSLNTGAQPQPNSELGGEAAVVAVKPVHGFLRAYQQALTAQQHNWLVVGGGAAAVEVVLAMAHRLRNLGSHCRLTLGYSGQLLAGYPRALVSRVQQQLQDYGVQCQADFRWLSWQQGQAIGRKSSGVADGVQGAGMGEGMDKNVAQQQAQEVRLPADRVWLCTPVRPAHWLAQSDLALSPQGFMAVTPELQSLNQPRVFAAGDLADCLAQPRPKAGVFAVRQAPTLAHNLSAIMAGRPLRALRLQQNFLSLLALGNQQAIGSKGQLPLALPWRCPRLEAWLWQQKNSIDRRFMRQFE